LREPFSIPIDDIVSVWQRRFLETCNTISLAGHSSQTCASCWPGRTEAWRSNCRAN